MRSSLSRIERVSANTILRSSYSDIVPVLVGEDKEKFYVYPDIICARSPYFDAQIRRWQKAGDPVTLSYDQPATFDLYLRALYSGRLPAVTVGEMDTDTFKACSELYILADKLGDLTVANSAIDQMHFELLTPFKAPSPTSTRVLSHLEVVLPVWDATPARSPLQRLLVAAYTHEVSRDMLCPLLDHDDMTKDLAVGIAQRLAKRAAHKGLNRIAEDVIIQCTFHQHNDVHKACGLAARRSSVDGDKLDEENGDSEYGQLFGLFD